MLTDEVPSLYAQRRPENVREKTGDVVRTNFAAHLYSYPFAKLARHPRMVEPIKQLFGEDVYMHQFKINGKQAFDGDVWQWHQDYGTWRERRPDARGARDERRDLPRRGERVQRPADVHPGQPQAGRARRAARHQHHQLSAVGDHQRNHHKAGREWRHRRAQGARRLDDPVPRLPGARVDLEPLAVEPRQRLPLAVRGVEPHPPLQAPGLHRAPRLHARSSACRTTACSSTTTCRCPGRTARPQEGAATGRQPHELYAKLQERKDKPAARRADRRGQVRRDVHRAGAEDAGRASGRHRGSRARTTRSRIWRAWAGRRRATARHRWTPR